MKTHIDDLRELQAKLYCHKHLKGGMSVYCWIERAAQGMPGGHREISHVTATA